MLKGAYEFLKHKKFFKSKKSQSYSFDGQYEITSEFVAEGTIPVTTYVSKTTGLKIYNCKVAGPRVVCHLALATDASGNDGLPYAVQHLVFMGSESHPYQGVLKKLSQICKTLSCWIDSSISIDHSSYEIHSIGPTGVLKLLPLCLEHILYPTLTENDFLTEVHHINGEGVDAGTMYSERMACENDGEMICQQAVYRAVYPENSHYGFRAKGLTKNLRESTTNAKVKEYHRMYYRPDNLAVIVIGNVESNDIFNSISPVVEKILRKGIQEKLSFPWRHSISPLLSSKTEVVTYPSYDESEKGKAYLSWRGPSIDNVEECVALGLIVQYLYENPGSPLKQAFVNTVNSYCEDVTGSLVQAVETFVCIRFQKIVRARQLDIKCRLVELLNDISSGKQDFDLKKMLRIINKKKISLFGELETNPHDYLCPLLITDFLYGHSATFSEQRMNQICILENLANKDALFWQKLLKKYLLTENIVVIIGEPSAQLQERLSEEEERRLEKQKQELGEEGLKHKALELQKASGKNKPVIDEELLTSVLLPSADTINFHHLVQSCNYEDDPLYDPQLKDIPCGFQMDNVKTNFINIWVLLDSGDLPLELRLYLPLLMEVLVKSAIPLECTSGMQKGDSAQVDSDILDVSVELSSDNSGSFPSGMHDQISIIKLKVEEQKYEKAIEWLYDILYKRAFTQLLIQECIAKEIQKLAVNSGLDEQTSFSLSKYLSSGVGSNFWCGGVSRQCNFMMELFDKNLEKVTEDLETLRKKLMAPDNVVIHVAADLEKLGWDLPGAWKNLSDLPHEGRFCRHKIKKDWKGLEELESSSAKSYIVDAGAEALCLIYQVGKGVKSWNDPDYPALHVLAFYLTQMQSALWVLMEDAVISYLIWNLPIEGIISIYMAAREDLVSAYKEMKQYIEKLLDNEYEWDESLIEIACSGAITNIIEEKENTVLDVSRQSILSYYNGTNRNYTRHVINEIHKVTAEDLKKVAAKYLLPLFDPAKSACFISSSTEDLQSIISGFKELSRNLEVVSDDGIISAI